MEELLFSLDRFSRGPKESHAAILTTNVFLFTSLVTCVLTMTSFVILKQKNQMKVLRTLMVFHELAIIHQVALVLLVVLQVFQLIYLLTPGAPRYVFLIQDVLFALMSHYLTIMSSVFVLLILFYSINLVYEIPKLFEIGTVVLQREHILRAFMFFYGLWFSALNKNDWATIRTTHFTSITFSFNPFDGLLVITASCFACKHMQGVYKKKYQRVFGNRVFVLISILLLIKLGSMSLNITAILLEAEPSTPTFFEVIRMSEGLTLGAVYVILKAFSIRK